MPATGFYPGDTAIEQHLSILLLGFRHRVSAPHVQEWHARAERLAWTPHPYLRGQPDPMQVQCGDRLFAPHQVLTPTVRETVFGTTLRDDPRFSGPSDRPFLQARLSRRRDCGGHVENLLLTRDAHRCDWLGVPLYLEGPSDSKLVFVLDWVDLWLFDDHCGILAFKVELTGVLSAGGAQGSPTLTDLSELHGQLRDWRDDSVRIARVDGDGSTHAFWRQVVFETWLGTGRHDSHLLMRDGEPAEAVFDGAGRYCRLLTGVQMRELGTDSEEMAWSAPLADPLPGYPYHQHFDELQRGEWGSTALAFQAAVIAGYPSFRDLFLLELATTSREGAAGGHAGQRGWQFSLDYIRHLFQGGGIKIWEYWSGLALRDVCAFVAWSKSMPLVWRGQLEARYYPLYAYVYHLRLELDHIASNCVDHNLIDAQRLRDQLRRFEIFRSRYWFIEVTRDFQGVEVYGRMKQGMRIDELFASVSEEVKEVGDYLERILERGRQALVAMVLVAAYPIYVWGEQVRQLPAVEAVVAQLKAFNAVHPGLGLLAILGLSLGLGLLLVLLWKPSARLFGRLLQPIFASIAQHRHW